MGTPFTLSIPGGLHTLARLCGLAQLPNPHANQSPWLADAIICLTLARQAWALRVFQGGWSQALKHRVEWWGRFVKALRIPCLEKGE